MVSGKTLTKPWILSIAYNTSVELCRVVLTTAVLGDKHWRGMTGWRMFRHPRRRYAEQAVGTKPVGRARDLSTAAVDEAPPAGGGQGKPVNGGGGFQSDDQEPTPEWVTPHVMRASSPMITAQPTNRLIGSNFFW